MDWSKAQVEGHAINPRAGHACIVVDGIMYIAGGGDNKSGRMLNIISTVILWKT